MRRCAPSTLSTTDDTILMCLLFRLSELLGLPVPILPSLASTLTSSIVSGGTSGFAASNEEIGGPGSLWIDEEDKKFYEDLRELRGEVPVSFLGVMVNEKGKGEGGEKEKEETKDGEGVKGEEVVEETVKEEETEDKMVVEPIEESVAAATSAETDE